MGTILEIINKIYEWSSFPERIATIYWIVFVFLYVILHRYEKVHNLLPKRKRKIFNFHGTLFLGGIPPTILHYASRHLDWEFMIKIVSVNKFGHLFFAGFIFLSVGLYFICDARIAMNGYWGVHIYEYEEDKKTGLKGKLITDKSYALCQHPVYLGQILMTLGTMMMVNNWWFVWFPIITITLSIGRAIKEGKELRQRFGDEYKTYCQNTAFIIPWVI